MSEFTPEHHALLFAHYERVAPLMVASFCGTPLVTGFVPDWSTKVMTFEETLHNAPASIATIEVPLHSGNALFATVAENTLLWQAHRGAISFLSWTPTHADPARAAFGRIILEPCGTATMQMVRDAALVFKSMLEAVGLRNLVLLNGDGGLSLWIPFADAPAYDVLRQRLDDLAREAATANPTLVTDKRFLSERGDRVHVACGSNAIGLFSALPYTLRACDALQVVTPIAWDELATCESGDVTAANFSVRLAEKGDVFAKEVAAIGAQSSTAFLASASPEKRKKHAIAMPFGGEPRGRIIQAAIAILNDGKPRDADVILAEAISRGLIPKTTTRKDVYTELSEYISRATGHQRKPKIIQDEDRRFRRNLPADDWPNPKAPLPKRPPIPNSEALKKRLLETSDGPDPADYELAGLAIFIAMGFVGSHIGGGGAPDGTIDAPLGVLAYRVMTEMKRASTIV